MRNTVNFNKDWRFILEDDPAFSEISADESRFRVQNLPHDWATEYAPVEEEPSGPGCGFGKSGIGWYRKHFKLENIQEDEKVFFYFEGVYMDSTVYVNGQKAGGHGYGFTSFYVDATPFVRDGENVIAVRVNDADVPNCRWYTGGGIYRDVYMVRTKEVHLDHFGLRASTNALFLEQDEAVLLIRAAVKNESDHAVNVKILHRVVDAEGKKAAVVGAVLHLEAGECGDSTARAEIFTPHLWTDEDPYLYTVETAVLVDEKVVDNARTRTGIRTAAFDKDKGFLLNGEQVKLRGMCMHQDGGLTGAVVYRDYWVRRLQSLKDMGCNAIRWAHNPPTPLLLDLCDEFGFLVMDEIFDEWVLEKDKSHEVTLQPANYGPGMYFNEHAEEELVTMIRRDFNHPSVILWSIGNEIIEQSTEDGVRILNFLQDICHREDASRMVTSACENIVARPPHLTRREFENALDVVGYNYVNRWRERAETYYEEDKLAYPDRRFLGTENTGTTGVRGDYSEKGGRRGNYKNMTLNHEPLWRYTLSRDFVAGDFLWTGFSYLGETWWPSRGNDCGPLDTAGFKKDDYYYYRSIWNKKDVTLHLAPHWNFAGDEGKYKQVVCYTNCDYVRLYINGNLVDEKGYQLPRYGMTKSWDEGYIHLRHITTNDLHLVFDVAYEQGTLRAEGYKDEELVAVEEVVTTGEAETLVAAADKTSVSVDGLIQVELSMEDAEGRHVPTACPRVYCTVEGPAHLVGLDAGNLRDLRAYPAPECKMFNGWLLAVVQADAPGTIRLHFETEDGKTQDVSVEAI